MQLYNASVNKKKLKAEAAAAQADAEKKNLENKQDAFDSLYQQLNKCMSDYTAISEEYRQYVEKARKKEESIQEQIHQKCMELADMKSQITYLKGIRCYNMTCEYRVRANPDKSFVVPEPAKAESEEIE